MSASRIGIAAGGYAGAGRRLHPRHAAMKDDIRSTRALRLGFRQISGFSEAEASHRKRARRGLRFVRDLWLRTRLKAGGAPNVWPKRTRFARSGSTGVDAALGGARLAAQRRQGRPAAVPRRDHGPSSTRTRPAADAARRAGDRGYRHLHLSLRAHPVVVRSAPSSTGAMSLRHERLVDIPSGRRVTVAGLSWCGSARAAPTA